MSLVLKWNACCRVSSMTGGGEGVFARRDIPPDTLVAIFNGVRHHLCSNLIKGLGIYCLWVKLTGQCCHKIFDFWFFSWISFPQAPEYTIRVVSIFFENSWRYSQLKVHHRCRWHRWQMEKIYNHKSLIILFGHLWEVELSYRYLANGILWG